MTSLKPFRPDQAKEALLDAGDYLLPICLAGHDVFMGEDLAVLVFETVEGQRVGVPMGMQALSDLREVVTEALATLQAGDRDGVQ